MNPKDFKVLQYFEYVDAYALRDLERMLESADYSSQYHRLAVPIAQSCFSLLDISGFLLRDLGSHSNPANELKNSSMNIERSLSLFFSGKLSQIERNVLIQLYRNGSVHTFFPKYVGIHNTLGGPILVKKNGIYNLNVNPLCTLLIQRLRELFNDFQANSFYNTILSNFEIYEADLLNSFNKFNMQLTNTTSSTLTTTVYQPPRK
jgi:hypothetical protein